MRELSKNGNALRVLVAAAFGLISLTLPGKNNQTALNATTTLLNSPMNQFISWEQLRPALTQVFAYSINTSEAVELVPVIAPSIG